MVKKGQDHISAEILDLEIGRSTLQPIGCEPDQQDEAVGIGLHRMPTYGAFPRQILAQERSAEHTSELQSLMRSSYAVLCLKKKTLILYTHTYTSYNTPYSNNQINSTTSNT